MADRGLELENPSNTFLEEARIDYTDEIDDEALKVIGKTEEYLRDKKKQSQKQLLKHFFEWVSKIKDKQMICHVLQYDYSFLRIKAYTYRLEFPIPHRGYDLHALAQLKFHQIKGKFKLKEKNGSIESDFGLPNILEFCGIEDERVRIEMGTGKVLKEGKPHDGLEDAKLEAECFYRIVHGKGLSKEYGKFKVPDYLKK